MKTTTPIIGKRALVTGATKGLGRELAIQLADAGADLVLLARNQAELERLAAELRRRDTGCDAIVCDLSKTDEIVAAAARVNAAGGVDILINNAGLGYYKPFLEHTGFNNGEAGTKDASWSLQPGEFAALILDVLAQPGFQMIDELTVHPQMQNY